MKIVLTIFALPHEVDDLENIITQLKKCSYYLSGDFDWFLDVTVCTSDFLTDWKKSSIPKTYFFERLKRIHHLSDWAHRSFQTSESIQGSLAQKRFSLEKHNDADYFLWLDPDIIFDTSTLAFIEQGFLNAKSECANFIISPEIVRMWDTTWDCLVNHSFMEKKVGYQAVNDPFIDCGVKGDVVIEQVINRFPGQPRFKIGSGFFSGFSSGLLRRIGLPVSFGQYGLEDTFIMWAAEKLVVEQKVDIRQFKLKNLVVCENYRYRNYGHMFSHLTLIDRKEEFKKISSNNFQSELKKIN